MVLVCYKIFDFDRDGVLNHLEINQLTESLTQLAIEQFPEENSDTFSLEAMDLVKDNNESVDLETFLMWAVKQNSLRHLLDMLHQVLSTRVV